MNDDYLEIAGKKFTSRLITGTSRFGRGQAHSPDTLVGALEESGAEILNMTIGLAPEPCERGGDPGSRGPSVEDLLDWDRFTLLPNTVGARTASEAVRIARLAREMLDTDWVKLEVSRDPKYLFPDPAGILDAAQTLVDDGFVVLPYIQADPVLARRLEDIGCAAVLPMASPIGTGQGIQSLPALRILIEEVDIPVLVAAGLGAPSDAAIALEHGADGVVVNMAISQSGDPVMMARAFRLGVEAGRRAYLAGRISSTRYAETGVAVDRPETPSVAEISTLHHEFPARAAG